MGQVKGPGGLPFRTIPTWVLMNEKQSMGERDAGRAKKQKQTEGHQKELLISFPQTWTICFYS